MSYLGENISLLEPLKSKGLLDEASHSQWNHKATFEWMEIAGMKGTRLPHSVLPIRSSTTFQRQKGNCVGNSSTNTIDHFAYLGHGFPAPSVGPFIEYPSIEGYAVCFTRFHTMHCSRCFQNS